MQKLSLGLRLSEINAVSGDGTNMCWTILTNPSGTLYTGVTAPTHTSDGTLIYNAQFDTSTGLFIFQFGVAGDEQLSAPMIGTEDINPVSLITIIYRGDTVVFQWDSVNLWYSGTNSDMANAMAANVGNKVCFLNDIDPELAIWYDYKTEAE